MLFMYSYNNTNEQLFFCNYSQLIFSLSVAKNSLYIVFYAASDLCGLLLLYCMICDDDWCFLKDYTFFRILLFLNEFIIDNSSFLCGNRLETFFLTKCTCFVGENKPQ